MQSDPSFNELDPGYIQCEKFIGWISLAVLVAGAVIAVPVAAWFWGLWGLGGAMGGVLLLMALTAYFSFVWPKHYFRNARWKLDDQSLEIHRGVLWKQRISIPLGRVQHADVSQGPVQRKFDLGKLTIHTAGTHNASIELEGLKHSVSLNIRDQLVRQTHRLEDRADSPEMHPQGEESDSFEPDEFTCPKESPIEEGPMWTYRPDSYRPDSYRPDLPNE